MSNATATHEQDFENLPGGGAGLPAETAVAIVGSGFSGLAMAAALKRAGRDDFIVLERARDVGGTWRDNTYPGCACDVPSHVYSFSFAPNPEWSSTFSPQPEIHAYLRKVASEEGILPHVRFGCEVEGADWDEAARCWRLQTSRGEVAAGSVVAGAGPLSEPSIPDIPGLRDFKGTLFHSATWDHDHDLEGERVAVIGTGASAIQFVPAIQPQVERLHLYQRTAPWIMPRPDRPLSGLERRIYRRIPGAQRLMRDAIYWSREVFAIPMLNAALSPIIRVLTERHLRRSVPRPRAAREADSRLRPRLQAHPRLQRLPAVARVRERRGADGRDRGDPGALGGRLRRSRARGRHDHPRHRLPRHRPADRRACSRRRGPLAGRALGRQPLGASRDHGRRLPQPVPAARAQHGARPQLGRLHGGGAGRLRAAGARAPRRIGARARSPRAPRPSGSGTRASNGACGGPSGPPAAARAGTSTSTAATRRSGPTSASASPRRHAASTRESTRPYRRRSRQPRRSRHPRSVRLD